MVHPDMRSMGVGELETALGAATDDTETATFQRYSVLMSTYRCDNPIWLAGAIESMLAQTVPPQEFVLVKDGPLGGELDEVVAGYVERRPDLFRVLQLPSNRGLGLALRAGVEHCTNELIARMDSDDIADPSRVEAQLRALARKPDLDVVGTLVGEFIESPERLVSKVKLPEHHEEIERFAKQRCPIRHSTLLLRKSAVVRAGHYRHVLLAEDYDLVVRMLQTGSTFYNVPQILHYVRVNSDFYDRRGGLKYLRSILAMKNEFRRIGFLTAQEFLMSAVPHIVVTLMPGSVRSIVYRKLLRR